MKFKFLQRDSAKVLILGRVDTGKSYLSFELLKKALLKRDRVALVCCDLGQANVGPPGCVSFKIFTHKDVIPHPSTYIPADEIEFVGMLSPVENMAYYLAMVKIVTDRAFKKSKFVIVNTCGFCDLPEAKVLKFLKIRLLSPDVIIAIQEKNELEDVLELFSFFDIEIIRVKKSKKVKRRSKEKRAYFRKKLFKEYFKNSRLFPLKVKERNSFFEENMLVGFLDKNLRTICLGVIKRNYKGWNVLAPYYGRRIKFIAPSSIFLEDI